MIWLWIAAAVVSAGAAALVVQRAAHAARVAGRENPALAVYQRQMTELDSLADQGLLAEAERRSVRAETGRRLLAAAQRAEPSLAVARPTTILIAAAAAPLLALGLYLAIGAPGFPDQPFAQRLKGWENAAANQQPLDPLQMAAVWRAIAAQRPHDPIPLRELARAELVAGEPLEAEQALGRALALDPGRADLWETLGEIDVVQANGDVDPDASSAFRKALAIDPNAGMARYYLARAKIAAGDVAGGLADWRVMEAGLAPDSPERAPLAAEIAEVSATGRLEAAPTQSPAVGPPQIQAMVDGLAARLQSNPDDPAGWVRLVRAYSVLGETDRRDAALAQARRRFGGRPDLLAALSAAARPPQ